MIATHKTEPSLVLIDQAIRMQNVPSTFRVEAEYEVRHRSKGESFGITRLAFALLKDLRRGGRIADVARAVGSQMGSDVSMEEIEACAVELIERGLLIAADDSGDAVAELVEADPASAGLNGVPVSPHTVTWASTWRCNLSCTHCINNAFHSPGFGDHIHEPVDELTLEQAVRFFEELDRQGVRKLEISGGEPSILKFFWELLEATVDKGFSVMLYTNGTRLNDDFVRRWKRLRDLKPWGFEVHTSMDGGDAASHNAIRGPRTGDIERLISGMERMAMAGCPIHTVESCVTRQSLSSIRELIDICVKASVRFVRLHPVEGIGRAGATVASGDDLRPNELEALFEEATALAEEYEDRITITYSDKYFPMGLFKAVKDKEQAKRREGATALFKAMSHPRKTGLKSTVLAGAPGFRLSPAGALENCGAGINRMFVSPSGVATPCLLYTDSAVDRAGNVRDMPLRQVWESNGFDRARQPLAREKFTVCGQCPHFDECGKLVKLCRIGSELTLGDYFGPSALCVKYAKELGIPESVVGRYREETPKRSLPIVG